jgi:hypothetical protein
MTDTETLVAELRQVLETYFSELRAQKATKKWLNNVHFRAMYEGQEATVRKSFDGFIETYVNDVSEAEEYREAHLNYTKEVLGICLTACKQVMERSADALVNAFNESPNMSR